MNRFICILCITLKIIALNNVVNARDWRYEAYIDYVKERLEWFDIVRDIDVKWDDKDNIKRRDVFEAVYIVTMNDRNLDNYTDKEFEYMKAQYYNNANLYSGMAYFDDIEEGSYDDHLALALVRRGLIKGNINDSNITADFDKYATYSDVLQIMTRLFTVYQDGYYEFCEHGNKNSNQNDELNYYYFMCDINMINTIYPNTLNIEISQLDECIKAYDFLGILYNALYVPTTVDDYEPIIGFRYIDMFLENKQQSIENSEEYTITR